MKYTKKQELISGIERCMPDNRYIENTREKGQQKIFK